MRPERLLGALCLAVVGLGCQANPQGRVEADTTDHVTVGPPPPGLELPTAAPDAAVPDTFARDVADDPGPEDTGAEPLVLPESLRPSTWLAHLVTDVLPYWTSPAALGAPVGNFPTSRGMDGTPQPPTERRPRMLSRQVFALVAGFLLTGDVSLLAHADAGVDWLAQHAVDGQYGGFHARLTAAGEPLGDDPKTAQDTAYAALGPALLAFATRDAEATALVEATHDLLLDPETFFDAGAGRIRDAMTADLNGPIDLDDDGGAELVAQLDPITAFLLHAERAVDPTRAAAIRDDLVTLGQALLPFISDGMVWGVDALAGSYGSKHADFGHALKTVWALHLIDARVPTPALSAAVSSLASPLLDRAFDDLGGRWAKRPLSPTTVEYGSDWWIYAEADQLQATLGGDQDRLAQTAAHWLADYVDSSRPAREIVPSVDRYGAWVWDWTDADTAKCNLWKSGYHSAEHALVMVLAGHAMQGTATLHFALEATHDPATEPLWPYLFGGQETARRVGATVDIGGRTLTLVEVDFLVEL